MTYQHLTARRSLSLWAAASAIALISAFATGCSAPSTKASSSVPEEATSPSYDMTPVDSTQSDKADKFIYALSRGGDGTAAKYVSRSTRFNWNKVKAGVEGCRLTTSWYSPSSGSTISGELTCSDGDMVAVDMTFDSSNMITEVYGQGVYREFDSTIAGN